MGKKLYTKENISKAETERLGIPELVVLKTNSDDVGLEVVHRRYFEDEKLLCPACRSSKTRCSKIVDRKLKDLLWLDEDHKTFQIISLLFHQRYMEERIHALDKEAEIICYGQEINPFTFGIAKADMLIRGGDPENMQFGDTLNADKFKGYTFDYIISNPPFGIDWKREAADVEKEHKLGDAGRFGVGLPQKSDGQMLFLLNGIAKLKDTGRMAIIQNGSSLFTGDAGSGPSEIRRYIIENDWLDAIVQLPNDSFYNTGIATYIWIVSKNKPETHRERILLIDASKCCEARRRPIGNKRVDITESCRNLITQAYSESSFPRRVFCRMVFIRRV